VREALSLWPCDSRRASFTASRASTRPGRSLALRITKGRPGLGSEYRAGTPRGIASPRAHTDPDVPVEGASGSSRRGFAAPDSILPPCGARLGDSRPSARLRLLVHDAVPASLLGPGRPHSPAPAPLGGAPTPWRPSRRTSFPSLRYDRCVLAFVPDGRGCRGADRPGSGQPRLRPGSRWNGSFPLVRCPAKNGRINCRQGASNLGIASLAMRSRDNEGDRARDSIP
jgi:hypothetical protein